MQKKSYRQIIQSAGERVGDIHEKLQRLKGPESQELRLRLESELWDPLVKIDRRIKKILKKEELVEEPVEELRPKVKKTKTSKKFNGMGELF